MPDEGAVLEGTPRDTEGEKLFGQGFPGKGSRDGKKWTDWRAAGRDE